MEMTNVILIALFIEAVVNSLKPLWSKGSEKPSISEFVSMAMGVLLAVACKINMLAYVVEAVDYPAWVEYVFYVLTGIAIGRGTNFVYDLWKKLKEWQNGAVEEGLPMEGVLDVDLEITHWNLAKLQAFCSLNGIATNGCTTREDYMSAIERGGRTEPPDAGDAE